MDARSLLACGLLALSLACAAPRAAPVATPATSSGAPSATITAEELAALRAYLAPGKTNAAPSPALVDAALRCLRSSDGAVRDGVGYEVLVRWLGKERLLGDAETDGLRARLLAQLGDDADHAGPGDAASDAVFGRSFAALALSLVAARELAVPRWSAAELAEQLAAAQAYAARERDLRGYVPGKGWAHAVAHTADWMKMLGRHPLLGATQAEPLAQALVDLAVRRHGVRLAHGEEDRLAAALRSLIDRDRLDEPTLDRVLTRLLEPVRAGWPTPFDLTLYVAQRNALALFHALFTSLSLADTPSAARALARLRHAAAS